MPKLDGSGPMGQGSMTGRGQGSCSNGGKRMFWCGRGLGARKLAQFSENTVETLEQEESIILKELERVRAEKEVLKEKK